MGRKEHLGLEFAPVRYDGPDVGAVNRPTFDSLTSTLDRLQVATFVRMGGTLDEPINAGALLSPLHEGIDRIRARLDHGSPAIPLATLEQARIQWAKHGPSLDDVGERNVRVLCTDSQIATSAQFVSALKNSGLLPRRTRWLDSLISSYFHRWRDMESPATLEVALCNALEESKASQARLKNLRVNREAVFSEHAARLLAQRVLSARSGVADVLAPLGVAKTANLAREVTALALELWVEYFLAGSSSISDADAMTALTYPSQQFMADVGIPQHRLACAVERLILWTRTNELAGFRQALEDSILSNPRLGDPRLLANRPNWDEVIQGRDAIVRWLSRRDLAFFFDFVMDQTEDPHGRKEFWSRYIDQVIDSTVALSPHDAYRLRLQVKERINHAHVTGTKDVSAFLMRFAGAKNLIIVEFSRPGNALYMHDAADFERRVSSGIRAKSFDLRDELKGNSMEEWFAHHPTPEWMHRVADFLRVRGIRPR